MREGEGKGRWREGVKGMKRRKKEGEGRKGKVGRKRVWPAHFSDAFAAYELRSVTAAHFVLVYSI